MRKSLRADVTRLMISALDKALAVQQPVVRAHVDHIMRALPTGADPEQVLRRLERQYLGAVTAMGAAAGATAAVPGIGVPAALPVNLAETATFLETSVLFIMAVAEVHGVDINDVERRRTLVLAILTGDSGTRVVRQVAGRTAPHWARLVVSNIPISTIRTINHALGRNFITKYGTKQGILVLGRELPLGFGALIGGAGNLGLGQLIVRATRNAFGPAALVAAA